MSSPTGTMLALQIPETSGEFVKLVSVPVPKVPAGHVLVKVEASYINPSDLMNVLGNFPSTTRPRIPGRDYSGVVVAGSDELLHQEVFGTSGKGFSFTEDGSHAEYCLIATDAIVKKPKALSFVQAATVGVPFATASIAVTRSGATASDTVMVLGASGAVGSAVAQIAAAKGCRVLTAHRRENADVNLKSDPKLARARELTDGKGPTVIIDTVGDPSLMTAALGVLAVRGRYTFISAPKAGSTDVTFDMKSLYRQEQTIYGVNSVLATDSEAAAVLRGLVPDFESGKLQPEPTTSFTQVKLGEEAIGAYGKMKNREAGKFLIVTS
jgi:NADPH2:quinone reductase